MLYCRRCQQTYEGERETCPHDGAPLEALTAFETELLDAELDGRFRLKSLLGRGGMGTVFLGEQLSVGREVAVKVLRSSAGVDESSYERFTREAKTMSELQHPNIVRLIDFGRDTGRGAVFLAMEYVRGLNLADVLARGRLEPAAGLEILSQICAALSEPHQRGIVHRDLKPDNISLLRLADESLQVKVLDFGIARTLENDDRLTETGVVCGTPTYMAPEQSRGISVDPRTDLYSLGVILYEMLAGCRPFGGESGLELMLQHVQDVPPALPDPDDLGDLHDDLQRLLDDLLAKEPEERPESAVALRDDIEAIRDRWDLEPLRFPREEGGSLNFDPWIAGARLQPEDIETNEARVRSPQEPAVESDEAVATTATPEDVTPTDLYDSEEAVPEDPETDDSTRSRAVGTDDEGSGADDAAEGTHEAAGAKAEAGPARRDVQAALNKRGEVAPDQRQQRAAKVESRTQSWGSFVPLLVAVLGGAGVLAAVMYVDGRGDGPNSSGSAAAPAGDATVIPGPTGSSTDRSAADAASGVDASQKTAADGWVSDSAESVVMPPAGQIADGGLAPSLTLGPNGRPWVAFLQKGNVNVSHWNGEKWATESVDSAGRVSAGLALRVVEKGRPMLAVRQSDDNHIELAVRREDGWKMEPIDRDADRFGFDGLAADSQGNLHLGYIGGDGAVWYAGRRGGSWMRERLIGEKDDYELSVQSVDTAVGADGHPRICAYDNTFRSMVYAVRGNDGWDIQTYESGGATGRNCSIAVDTEGRAVVVFTRSASAAVQEVSVVRRTESGWEEMPTIEDHPSMTPSYDMVVDADGHPRFTYTLRLDADTSALKYVRWNGSRWLSTEITRKLPAQLPTEPIATLEVGADGQSHIVYADRTGLQYLRME